MNCDEARRLLHPTVPPLPGGPLADHLESCTGCGAYAMRLAQTMRALADHHAGVEPDAGFAARVVAALPRQNPLVVRFALRLLPVALALVLVLTGWILIEQRRHTVVSQETVPTDDLLTWVLRDGENGS